MEKSSSILINILRWIAVIPGSIIGYIIFYAMSKIVNLISTGYWSIDVLNTINISLLLGNLFVYGFAGYCSIATAAYIAPKAKYITSIIMSILWCIIFVISIIPIYSAPLLVLIMHIANAAASLIGMIVYVCSHTSSLKENKDDLNN